MPIMNPQLLNALKELTEEEKKILEGHQEIDTSLYTSLKHFEIDSEKLLQHGKLIHLRTHTRFIDFPEHTHNYVELVYMCKGQTVHYINGEEVVLKAGDLLFLNQHAKQAIKKAGQDDIAVNFIIVPAFFDASLQMLGDEESYLKQFLIGCLTGEHNAITHLHFKVQDILPIQNLIENLVWTLLHQTPNKRSINQTTMGLLFLQLLNHMDRVDMDEKKVDYSFEVSVYQYIEEHYREGTLKELSQILHSDIYWVSKKIKATTGRTYKALLQDKRLRQTAYLLQSTQLSIAEIGAQVGYSNLSYFHRLFKEKYHLSPAQYRQVNHLKM